MKDAPVIFIGLLPGPLGREPIFKVTSLMPGYQEGSVLHSYQINQVGFSIPEEEQSKVVQALHSWNNSYCDD